MSDKQHKEAFSPFSPALFWDVDNVAGKPNVEWVVARVVEMGTLDDFKRLLVFYGKETVKSIVLRSARLSARDIHFLSFYFEVDKSQFACYTKKQLPPKPLRYWNP
ncbi:MAG: hypothetical protein LBU42_04960 [Prevotellaceae bacterium]|jgi:hypothetical protein|nr:hypothetical protein [Prevotellaceae bacterium]